MQIDVHKKARQMLLGITDYYAEYGGMHSVNNLLETIRSKSEWILKYPQAGTPEPLLAGRRYFYRFVRLNRNIKMIYYVRKDTVHIAAFWDMRMSPQKLKKKI